VKLSITQEFNAPLDLVLKAREARYDLLPDLKKPDIFERKEEGNLVKTKRRFQAGGQLPGGLKKFAPAETMEFVDHSVWDGEQKIHRWKIVSERFEKVIHWEGSTKYEEITGEDGTIKTRREMRGEIKVRIPFVGDQLEKTMVSGFKKNFEKDYEIICKAIGLLSENR